ncbi:hypothetical protein DYH10_03505 [Candidatus Saccharibacteria bacterium CPR2]|nr:hypothetical protein [Candidatus Saccharibacteria bacterium CPR2]
MSDKHQELDNILEQHFEISEVSWGEQEDFDATNMATIHEDKADTVSNKGHFTVHNFVDKNDNRYKLVHYKGNFQDDDELVTFMKDAEYSTIKDYETVQPKTSVSNYTLYKLIPYTVNGEPQW